MKLTITFEREALEKALTAMRDEVAREMVRPDASPDSKRAWYYSQVGAYELAQQMGWITDAERQRLVWELDSLSQAQEQPATEQA